MLAKAGIVKHTTSHDGIDTALDKIHNTASSIFERIGNVSGPN